MTIITSEAAFDQVVNLLGAPAGEKTLAMQIEHTIWGNDGLPMTVAADAYGNATFTVTGAEVRDTIKLEPTPSLLPGHPTTSPTRLLHEIMAVHDDYLGACNFWADAQLWGKSTDLLGLCPAHAVATTHGVESVFYSAPYTMRLITTPHGH
jgi:hypothetical protein